MSAAEPEDRAPTREECARAAGDIYGRILADPERSAQIREVMARYDADRSADTSPASKSA